MVGRAQDAFPALRSGGRQWRAGLLDALASGLEGSAKVLSREADRETGLGPVCLKGELTRSAFQLRLFADALREGGYLEATIDHAPQTPMGPAPDIRRMLVPLGPVAVFGASNFAFAFSVAGGDTASALAAGSPHPSPRHAPMKRSRRPRRPSGTTRRHHRRRLRHGSGRGARGGPQASSAVGFRGSLSAARTLRTIIDGRAPIPFYGAEQRQSARSHGRSSDGARRSDRGRAVRLVHQRSRPVLQEARRRLRPCRCRWPLRWWPSYSRWCSRQAPRSCSAGGFTPPSGRSETACSPSGLFPSSPREAKAAGLLCGTRPSWN